LNNNFIIAILLEVFMGKRGRPRLFSYSESAERSLASYRKYRETHPKKCLLYSAQLNARQKNLECTITEDDIEIPTTCPLLGCVLTNIQGAGRQATNMSIDRIDPSMGYIKGNIQIISDKANRMKQNATKEELVRFAEGVLSIYI
jgi:hypothetical protein